MVKSISKPNLIKIVSKVFAWKRHKQTHIHISNISNINNISYYV